MFSQLLFIQKTTLIELLRLPDLYTMQLKGQYLKLHLIEE